VDDFKKTIVIFFDHNIFFVSFWYGICYREASGKSSRKEVQIVVWLKFKRQMAKRKLHGNELTILNFKGERKC
jgi:hypothetical protein